MKVITLLCFLIMFFNYAVSDDLKNNFETDTIRTSTDQLLITFIGHGTLMFKFNDLVVHVDPVSRYANYDRMPKGDIILITHHHGDHLDPKAIKFIAKKDTKVILTESCLEKLQDGIVMVNGDEKIIDGITIHAVPAYNLVHKRDDGTVFHPKGVGNGYVITFGNEKVYVAGDTENIPEMKDLKDIDIAFLPMNLPYTMTPKMVADAVDMIKPKILYPYHFGDTNTDDLLKLLKDKTDLQVRIRKME
jgi:L-ascorbate metabolism protein UlaG (beta-lactamase superfamily)